MAGAGRKDWTAGAQVAADDIDTYLQEQTVMQFATSAARDTALAAILDEGLLTSQADSNSITAYTGSAWSTIGPLWGAWTSWTPVVTQGVTPTLTATGSRYMRIGRLIIASVACSITSAGTAATDVTVSLPVNAAGASTLFHAGRLTIEDTSATTRYHGTAIMTSASTVKISQDSTPAASSWYGSATFTAALASGDFIFGTFMYEAAADA